MSVAADHVTHPRRDHPEPLVAAKVSFFVVDLLEVIDVDPEHAEDLVAGQPADQDVEDAAVIEERCQVVIGGVHPEGLLGRATALDLGGQVVDDVEDQRVHRRHDRQRDDEGHEQGEGVTQKARREDQVSEGGHGRAQQHRASREDDQSDQAAEPAT
jgi:hypothetical protein